MDAQEEKVTRSWGGVVMLRRFFVASLLPFGTLPIAGAPAPQVQVQPRLHCLLGEAQDIYALTYSPDGKRLLAAETHDETNKIVEWDTARKSVLHKSDADLSGRVEWMVYSKSGEFLAIGYFDSSVSVRDSKRVVALSFRSVENPGDQMRLVSLCEADKKAGPFVYTVVACQIAQRRTIATGRTSIYYIPFDGDSLVNSAAATRDGITCVCCTHKSLRLYHQGVFKLPRELKAFGVFKDPCITTVAISDDASIVMANDYGGDLAVFDVKNDKVIKKMKGHDDGTLYAIIPFRGLNWFATGNDSGEIKIWDEKGNVRAVLKHKDHATPITTMALTPDNGFLASAGEGRPIMIWDLRAFLDKAMPKGKGK